MSFKLLIPAGLLAALLMLNPTALAVGLGQVEVNTRLNEPLSAEIPLRSVSSLDTDELEVSLASAEEFARVGIDRPGVLTRLTFTVEGGERGPVVRVTSDEPITEPFLSFLVRVSWPQGRLLREYTVLLDPPVTAPAAAPQPRQAASQAVQREDPADAGAPEPSRPVAGEPGTRQPEAGARPSGGTYGPVVSGETLWSIANRSRPDDSISVNQMMLALLRTNPDAFFRDNINALRRGAVLRIPDRGDIQRLGAAEALAAVRRQNDLWQDYRRNLAEEAPTVVAGGETQERAPVEDASDDEGSRLELVPPREGEADAGAVAAGPGEQAAEADREALREELARAREDLLARREQTDQLDGRVNELETQVERLQRLLELKNEELAAIQAQSDQQSDGQTPSEGPDPLAMDEGAAEEPGADDQVGMEETGEEDADLAGQPGAAEGESDAAPGAASQAQEPVEESATDESDDAAPPPPPSSGGWTDLLLSPVVLGIAGLLLIGVGVALFLHRRGSPQAQSTVQRDSLGAGMTRREERPAEATAETPPPAEPEEEFGPPETGPADYDEAALRAALEENPEDTETRLKLIRHYAAAGDREAFVAQAETLYADLADPASPAWLETRELGEDIAPDHALFGGGGDIRGETDENGQVVPAPEAERFDYPSSEPEAGTLDTGETPETEPGTPDRDTSSDLPDLDFESPAPDQSVPEEPAPEEPSAAEPEIERPTGHEPSGEDEGFDLSGLETEREEESAADSATPESGDTVSYDLGDMAESRETEEQEPLEFDLSDFETESESGSEGESEAEDWMTSSGAETETFEAPDSESEPAEGRAPEVGEETAEPGGEAAPGAGGDAVETKLELAEAYMDMSDEEGAREMLEEILSEGDEGQQKRAREMLDKLS